MGAKSIRILMTADTLGGVWNYSIDLCRSLQNYPVEFHLATMGAPLNESQRRQLDDIPEVNLYESNFKLEWMHDPWEDTEKAYQWIRQLYLDIRPDLMHFNNYAQAQYPWEVPVLLTGHSCVLSWWRAVKQAEAPDSWATYKTVVSKALSGADMIVAPTASFLQELKNIYGFSAHSQVIHNARIIPEQPDMPQEPFILCAGRLWDEAKNIQVLTELARDLPWPVYVAGENKHPVTKKVLQTNNIHYLGALTPEDLFNWMKRASIYVHPAHYEPFGFSVLEAAQLDCALVLSGIASLKELWDDAALFTDQRDPKTITHALKRLIELPVILNDYSRRAAERASRYRPHIMAKTYFECYNDLKEQSAKRKISLIGSEL